MAKYIMSCANSAETQYYLNWGQLNKPYVVYQEDTQQIDFNSLSATPNPYFTQYLTMTSQSDFYFSLIIRNGAGRSEYYQYSVDGGDWESIQYGNTSPTFSGGSVVRLRGNLGYISKGENQQGSFNIGGSGVHVYGNILSIVNGDDFTKNINVIDYCFAYAFSYCNAITSIENLVLPSMSNNCYMSMFDYCQSLTDGRCILPMKILNTNCYNSMFTGCSVLTQAPELPATTLDVGCYQLMFNGCNALVQAPDLPAEKLERFCYEYMFQGCFNLNYIKCLATDISAQECTYGWTNNVQEASGTFVKNPNMTNWVMGTNGIPNNWTIEDNV